MSKYFIMDAKCGATATVMSPCGPVPGMVVAEIKVKNVETNEVFFLSDIEEFDTVNISKNDKSVFEDLINKIDDEAFNDEFNKNVIVPEDTYPEFYERYHADDTYDARLYKSLIYLIRASWDDTDSFKSQIVGKMIDEIDIPISDIEQEYISEM